MNSQTIGIAIPTLNAAHLLPKCIPPLLASPEKPRILIIDSSSKDQTVKVAEKFGIEIIVIPRDTFNHGTTRDIARKHLGTDIVIMMTPDAIAVDNQMIGKLIQPIVEEKAVASYARQIPHDHAEFFEAFPREFNYPPAGHIRNISDIERYGIYTFFCSDSCAAYLNSALEGIGGFQKVLIGEDTVAVAQLLRKGYSVSYTADAIVKHSHDYSLIQEFRHYFDTGIARRSYANLIECPTTDGQRGKQYVTAMLKKLIKEKPTLLPYAILQSIIKWAGYRIGHASMNAPLWFKRRCSGHPGYWKK